MSDLRSGNRCPTFTAEQLHALETARGALDCDISALRQSMLTGSKSTPRHVERLVEHLIRTRDVLVSAQQAYEQIILSVSIQSFTSTPSRSAAATATKERRATRRYDLSLPIAIRGLHGNKVNSWTGKTRNISRRGVYFSMDSDLNVGVELELAIAFPSEGVGDTEVFVRATGRVVRTEKLGNGYQTISVAAMFDPPEIVRNKAAIGSDAARDELEQFLG